LSLSWGRWRSAHLLSASTTASAASSFFDSPAPRKSRWASGPMPNVVLLAWHLIFLGNK
jgi:hypothetical protein